jgi:hypothetical protein
VVWLVGVSTNILGHAVELVPLRVTEAGCTNMLHQLKNSKKMNKNEETKSLMIGNVPELVEAVRRDVVVTEPPRKGVRHQDQLERFSTKREHNQHTSVQYHIIHSSRSYYNLGSRISYTKEVGSQNYASKDITEFAEAISLTVRTFPLP